MSINLAKNAPARERTFKTFKKLDEAAMAWLLKNKDKVIEMHTRTYAGREYVFVNHYVR